MQLDIKTAAATLCVTLLAGILIGKELQDKVEPKTEIKTVEVLRDKIVTVTKTIKLPNGTIEVDSTKTENKVDTIKQDVVVQAPAPKWEVGITYDVQRRVGIEVQYRLISNLFVIGGADSSTARIGLGIQF
jgi:hypothetical protein